MSSSRKSQTNLPAICFTLGILSFVCLPCVGGLGAVLIGNKAGKLMDEGEIPDTHRIFATLGVILGMINLIICFFYFLSNYSNLQSL